MYEDRHGDEDRGVIAERKWEAEAGPGPAGLRSDASDTMAAAVRNLLDTLECLIWLRTTAGDRRMFFCRTRRGNRLEREVLCAGRDLQTGLMLDGCLSLGTQTSACSRTTGV